MRSHKQRPLIVVPGALKSWFIKASSGSGNVVMFSEVRGIDPTMPGLDEFEALVGNVDLLPEDIASPASAKSVKPVLRLIALRGRRLDR